MRLTFMLVGIFLVPALIILSAYITHPRITMRIVPYVLWLCHILQVVHEMTQRLEGLAPMVVTVVGVEHSAHAGGVDGQFGLKAGAVSR